MTETLIVNEKVKNLGRTLVEHIDKSVNEFFVKTAKEESSLVFHMLSRALGSVMLSVIDEMIAGDFESKKQLLNLHHQEVMEVFEAKNAIPEGTLKKMMEKPNEQYN